MKTPKIQHREFFPHRSSSSSTQLLTSHLIETLHHLTHLTTSCTEITVERFFSSLPNQEDSISFLVLPFLLHHLLHLRFLLLYYLSSHNDFTFLPSTSDLKTSSSSSFLSSSSILLLIIIVEPTLLPHFLLCYPLDLLLPTEKSLFTTCSVDTRFLPLHSLLYQHRQRSQRRQD